MFLKNLSLFVIITLLQTAITPTVLADIIPPESHKLERCVTITGLSEFSDMSVIGFYQGPTTDGEGYYVEENSCLTQGYKFNDFAIYIVPKWRMDEKDITKESIEESRAGLLLSGIRPDGGYIENSNPLTKEEITYLLTEEDNTYKLEKQTKISTYNDGTPKKIENFTEQGSSNTSPTETGFSDVNANDTYYDAINFIRNKKIVNGYSDGTFKLHNNISRDEFLKIVIEAKFSDTEIATCPKETYSFPDATGYWIEEYACIAKKAGIVNGASDGNFYPKNNISLAEALKIVLESFELNTEEVDLENWMDHYRSVAEQKNVLTKIYKYNTESLKRGEMAQLIYNILEQ